MSSHYDRCVREARAFYSHLSARADRGEINRWNIENLMNGFVDEPAYSGIREAVLAEVLPTPSPASK